MRQQTKQTTSWQNINQWYDQIVGNDGMYYHRQIIIPKIKQLLKASSRPIERILDLACGQGVLARAIAEKHPYVGLDLSNSLIKSAKKYASKPNHHFHVADITKPFSIKDKNFSHSFIILALQNIEDPKACFSEIHKCLIKRGTCIIVLNHPCFRIPRQSHWGYDEKKHLQYRKIDLYNTPVSIPIQMNPGMGNQSNQTISFHRPLSQYIQWLSDTGFVIEDMQEWFSDKHSIGKNAKQENRARKEFPLFMTLVARKFKF